MTNWFNGDWDNRFKITSDSSKVSASIKGLAYDLSNAPIQFWNLVNEDGSDIRITRGDGTTLVARDVISIDTINETGLIRFDTGDISTGEDEDYYIYFGNESATEPSPSDTFGQYSAYDSDMVSYWGFEEGSGSTTSDRTQNENHGTLSNQNLWGGEPSLGVGGIDADSGNHFINVGTLGSFGSNIPNGVSFIWAQKWDSIPSSDTRLAGVLDDLGTNTQNLQIFQRRSGSNFGFQIRPNGASISGNFQLLAGMSGTDDGNTHVFGCRIIDIETRDGDLFLDGAKVSSTDSGGSVSNNWQNWTRDIYLAAANNRGSLLSPTSGQLDEFLLFNRGLGDGEFTTISNNIVDNASFWTTGAFEGLIFAIKGTVTLDGNPVEGADVRLINTTDDIYIGSFTTPADGTYSFTNLLSDKEYHALVQYKDGSNNEYNTLSLPFLSPEEVDDV